MGMQALTQWLSFASQPLPPLALSLVHIRAGHLAGLLESGAGASQGIANQLGGVGDFEVQGGLRELQRRVAEGDPDLVPQLTRRLQESPDLGERLARDTEKFRLILAGGETTPLRQEMSPLVELFNDLGKQHRQRERPNEAIKAFAVALSIARATFPPGHSCLRVILSNIATVHYERGELDRAEFMCRRALKITEKTLGARHVDYARNLANLADIYAARGHMDVATRLLQRAMRILIPALGSRHPEVVHLSQKPFA